MSPARRKSAAAARSFRAPRDFRRGAPVFAALGDDVRLALVTRLSARGPMSTMRLSEGAGVTRQAVSKHLEVLAGAGVVHSTRQGRERIWEVDSAPLHAAQEWLDAISRDWDRALSRLKAFVEE
ncbi:MAG: metalloregulator ArsR/SmtB family transcription factor [bacterium]